ncbi:MAG: DUF1559 domain-containing protein [Gemmataceae bacterium]|nr:DUF1559 domain-containing protein [Gemmataceae bacterium]
MRKKESSPPIGLIIGIIVGAVVVVVLVLGVIVVALFAPAVQRTPQPSAAAECKNQLKIIGLAIHAYHDTYNQLPPAVVYDAKGRPLYSWRVVLLPFIEENPLYRQFKLDEPWDSPNNLPLLQQMPSVYMHPGVANADPTMTYFQVFDGPAGDRRPRALFGSKSSKRIPFKALSLPAGPIDLFQSDPAMKFRHVVDGVSRTIMVAEAADAVPWTKPADLEYDPATPLPKLGAIFPASSTCSWATPRCARSERRRSPTRRCARP